MRSLTAFVDGEGDEVSGTPASAQRNDDVLLALPGVGHRHARGLAVECGFPHDLACRLIEGAELLAARPWRILCHPVRHEDETFGDERTHAPGNSQRRKIEPLQRRMVSRPVPVRDGPLDLALVE